MTIAFAIKILGALIIAVSHRVLIRAAREEGIGWWISTMLIPGAAIFYGLRNVHHYARTLLAIGVGGCVMAGAFGLEIYGAFQEAKKQPHAQADATEDREPGDDSPSVPPLTASATSASTASISPELQRRIEQLQKRHAALTAERATLNVNSPDAVKTFNLHAADYHALKRQIEAEMAQPGAR